MEMLTLPLSIVAFIATLWVTSFFANLLHAKKPDMAWIALSWLIAVSISIAILLGIKIFIVDKYLEVAVLYFVPLLSFTLAYKIVNKMNWSAAITTNIITISVGAIAIVITIISLGKPLEKTLNEMAVTAGLSDRVIADDTAVSTLDLDNIDESEEEIVDVVLTDADLLSPKVKAALDKQKKREVKSYKEPKFRLISLRRARGAIGYKIRLLKNNGKVVEGALSRISGGELIVKQNLYGGIATTPIAMNSIKKLEVYR
ncbi:MAG: hypothetical protein DSZ29_02355 [Aquificaceae bacterium]|nr:MAG: hypothetical protein DSZ29_02355 [Aquificaceae bacterium]